jgi:hypothetical protein
MVFLTLRMQTVEPQTVGFLVVPLYWLEVSVEVVFLSRHFVWLGRREKHWQSVVRGRSLAHKGSLHPMQKVKKG